HSIAADFWSRLVSLDKKIDPSAVIYAGQQGNTIKDVEFVKRKSVYRNLIGLLSPYLRGELLSHLDPQFSLAIFGGDPGYLNSLASDRRIESQVITYYPPTSSYTETQNLYADSKINLNITSPQFDDAVVNRVIDVAAVGGFILTDWKPDLVKLTAVSEQISYRTIEELNSKIHYYITHNDERLEVARQLHQDVAEKCSYEQVIRFCLSRLNFVDDQLYSQSEVMQVDLGCGSHKPDGFIGVDVSSRPGVDIVADLNRRFPFPDNSVDFLRAFDVIEHLSDRIHTMNEIWRICKPDAQVDIRVPSTDGRGAFQDPTHVSFWNINSFKYYSIEFPEYLDLCRSYGFQGAFSIISLTDEETSPDRVIHVRAILRANKFDISPLHDLHKNLKLREINLIITPDWCQSDDSLYPPIVDVIRTLSQHPNRQQITLLVDKGNFPNNSETSPEQIFYELVFNLFLTEDIDVEDEDISISFIEDLAANKSTGLFQEITCRVLLPQENSRSLKTLENVDFPVCDLATLSI
ncbi:MAG TPA: glycosyltransferase, partial [Thermosynechococcaceae cyanobacterium]